MMFAGRRAAEAAVERGQAFEDLVCALFAGDPFPKVEAVPPEWPGAEDRLVAAKQRRTAEFARSFDPILRRR